MDLKRFFSIILTFCLAASVNAQSPIDLYSANGFGIAGDTLVMAIKTNHFQNVISFQASVNWDPAAISYLGVSDFGIVDFGQNSFGTTMVDQGHLRFLWEPTDGIAKSLADSTILFVVRFKIISTQPVNITLGFVDKVSSSPYPVEFADASFQPIAVTTTPGDITIVKNREDLVNIVSVANRSCDAKKSDGSLKADIVGDSTSFTFVWFEGPVHGGTPVFTGYRYDSLAAGQYSLQVLHGNNTIYIDSVSAIVDEQAASPADTIEVLQTKAQTSCSTNPDTFTGALEINVNGNQPANTYTIRWWHNSFESGQEVVPLQNRYLADTLAAGQYEVSVARLSDGCANYKTMEVMLDTIIIDLSTTTAKNNFCADKGNGSATVMVNNPDPLKARAYWFHAGEATDTTSARFVGWTYDSLAAGDYTVMVVDQTSTCQVQEVVTVVDSAIYTQATIIQQNDTLFSGDERSNWFRNDIFLNRTGSYLVPSQTGSYAITINNEYGCFSKSEKVFFGITALTDPIEEQSVYPNPFSSTFSIPNADHSIQILGIYNLKGQKIDAKYDIKEKFIEVTLSSSSEGIYLLKLKKGNKKQVVKVIKNLSK